MCVAHPFPLCCSCVFFIHSVYWNNGRHVLPHCKSLFQLFSLNIPFQDILVCVQHLKSIVWSSAWWYEERKGVSILMCRKRRLGQTRSADIMGHRPFLRVWWYDFHVYLSVPFFVCLCCSHFLAISVSFLSASERWKYSVNIIFFPLSPRSLQPAQSMKGLWRRKRISMLLFFQMEV